MNINSMLLTDGYKVGHPFMMPKGSEMVYSNWTPRKSRKPGINKVVYFGMQYIIQQYFVRHFEENFFKRDKYDVINEYQKIMDDYLGEGSVTTHHIEALHDLGYLPIEVRAIPEGSYVPIRTPMMTIHNTHKDFYWLTNYLETLVSNLLWMPCTSATIAKAYREVLDFWAEFTGSDPGFVPYQGHDFSFRGMPGIEAGALSGAGHLLSFYGTDTVPAISFLRDFYSGRISQPIGASVPATEHSVMCMHGKDGEFELFKELIFERFPTGVISIVSDTWNLWQVFDYLERLKDDILARDGKVVIRPDSSWTTPADIVCGITNHPKLMELPEGYRQRAIKGVVENLYDIFGGTINEKGYKVLDSHVGCIYGDAITLEGCQDICARLASKGLASSAMVFGIGSFTYQYNTRDTFGFAMKATAGKVDGEYIEIFKDPITDTGEKTSAKGFLRVSKGRDGALRHEDGVTFEESQFGELRTVFKDGVVYNQQTLREIREKLAEDTILQKRLVLT